MSSRFWFGDLGNTWNFADFDHGLSKSLTYLIQSHDLARGLTDEVGFLADASDATRGLTTETGFLPDAYLAARGFMREDGFLPDAYDAARALSKETGLLPGAYLAANALTKEAGLLPDAYDAARALSKETGLLPGAYLAASALTKEAGLLPDAYDALSKETGLLPGAYLAASALTKEAGFLPDAYDVARGLTKDLVAIASGLDAVRSWTKDLAATREFIELNQGMSRAAAYLADMGNSYRTLLKDAGATTDLADFGRGLLKGMASINEHVAPFRKMRFTVAGELVDDHRHAIRTPAIDVDWLLKATPSSSEVARGVDSIFDAILGLAATSSEPQRENREASPVGHAEKRGQNDSKPRLWVPRSARSQRPTNGESKSTLEDVASLSPVTIFCDYAHADREFLDELMKHLVALKSSGIAQIWHHGQVLAGEDRERLIMEHLELAKIILLLVSADYLDTLWEQNKASRIEAQIGRAIVVPVLVRSVDIEGTFIERLSPLPSTGLPIKDWTNSDTGWTHVARGIRAIIEGSRSASRSLIPKMTRR